MRIVAMIPARMGASRFPGKPLAPILDLPMVEHVRRRVLLSSAVEDVYVATCDQAIFDTVKQCGGKAIMTANTHERCTDRIEEAMQKIDADIVVIVQGDEPLFVPSIVGALTKPMIENPDIVCANILSVISDQKDLNDKDIVKAVIDAQGYVIYYSRAPIPHMRVQNNCPMYRQTGLSAFTKDFLHQYTSLPPTPKEIAESVDFLRIIDHRFPVFGVIYNQKTVGVDREDDVAIVEKILREDPMQRDLYQHIL